MENRQLITPRCHNTPMTLSSSGNELWHECSHCGHFILDSELDGYQADDRTPIRADNTSGYRGVTLTANGKWRAAIDINKVRKDLGCHVDILDAAKAYQRALQQHTKGVVI